MPTEKEEVRVRFGGKIRRLRSGVRLFGRGALPSLLVVPWMPALDACLGKPADGGHATMCESESESAGAGDKYGIRLEPGSRAGR